MTVASLPLSNRSDGPLVAAALDKIHERLAEIVGCKLPDAVDPEGVPAPLIFELERRLALREGERDAVLFAAAAELYGPTAELVAKLGAGPPTVGLVLRVCERLEWLSLRPDGVLRRARLLALGSNLDARFTERAVAVDEEVMHFLNGVLQLSPQLTALALPAPQHAVPTDNATVDRIAEQVARLSPFATAAISLDSDDSAEGFAHAVEALRRAGFGALAISTASLPTSPNELASLRDLWLRDSLLHNLGLVLICNADGTPPSAAQISGWAGPLLFVGLGRRPALLEIHHIAIRHDGATRLAAWEAALGDEDRARHAPTLGALAARFRLSTPSIRTVASEHGAKKNDELWYAARAAARPDDLEMVERSEPVVQLSQVILPEDAKTILETMVAAARVHHRILADWRGSSAGGRGLGIAALFSGESGTGKTMAAEAIAHELKVDLYRVEVSAVVSKYIGETEKNLRRIFAAAEAGGGVLLFDEADTLFGKRSEVRDSHDRYANMEIGYLLQLMEGFAGLAILTSNFEDGLDEAFKRRLRFIVQFPLPGFEQRQKIWEGAFPRGLRTKLDASRLARLPLSGGAIRNIALGAAFRFAAEGHGRAVTMAHVLAAARAEYWKLGRPLIEIDGKDWS